jgi:hypothetical protein
MDEEVDTFINSLPHQMITDLVGPNIILRSTSTSTHNSTENSDDDSSQERARKSKILSDENLQSFIMDSPFSFRNPIFFTVPREQSAGVKEVKSIASRRLLFSTELGNTNIESLNQQPKITDEHDQKYLN